MMLAGSVRHLAEIRAIAESRKMWVRLNLGLCMMDQQGSPNWANFGQYAAGPTLFFYLISPSGPMPVFGPFHKVVPVPSPTMISLVDARGRETLKFDHTIKSLTGTRSNLKYVSQVSSKVEKNQN